MNPRPIIIDTDPGQDDAIAILMALASSDLDVLAVTCVAGNVPLALTARNARILCELAGRTDVPVFAGCPRPMVHPLVTAEYVHGESGLDGPSWSEPTMPLQDGHAVEYLVDTLRGADDGSVTLVPVGPLTNIGMALVLAPEIAGKIREIVLMGGAYWEGGNVTPVAEFNIYVDPHAAHVVFSSGVPIVVHPLDVTHKALMAREWIETIGGLRSDVGRASAAMMSFYERFDEEKYGTRGGPLHDPHTIAYLLRPDLYGGRDCAVTVDHESPTARGQTQVDWWRVTDRPSNCRWINEVDADGFFGLVAHLLGRY